MCMIRSCTLAVKLRRFILWVLKIVKLDFRAAANDATDAESAFLEEMLQDEVLMKIKIDQMAA